MNWIMEPWPWYVSGSLMAIVLFTLLYAGKTFGLSSNLRTMCTIAGAGKTTEFFRIDWKKQQWNLLVMVGVVLGGFIGSQYLSHSHAVDISEKTVDKLEGFGFENAGDTYLPAEIFGPGNMGDLSVVLILLIGGLLVGFGARYAGGCTSGHAITGLSNLQLPSLIAVIGFFIGGLTMVHLVFPLIF